MAVALDDQAATELRDLIIGSMNVSHFSHMTQGQFVLWNRVVNGYAPDDPRLSLERLYEPTIDRLRTLSVAAGGWWNFPNHENSVDDLGYGYFVTMPEWQAIHVEKGIAWPVPEI